MCWNNGRSCGSRRRITSDRDRYRALIAPLNDLFRKSWQGALSGRFLDHRHGFFRRRRRRPASLSIPVVTASPLHRWRSFCHNDRLKREDIGALRFPRVGVLIHPSHHIIRIRLLLPQGRCSCLYLCGLVRAYVCPAARVQCGVEWFLLQLSWCFGYGQRFPSEPASLCCPFLVLSGDQGSFLQDSRTPNFFLFALYQHK